MTTRRDVVTQARTWIGTPYIHQGRLKHVGVDCVGLPICVCKELDLLDINFDVNGYARDPDGTLMAQARKHLIEKPFSEAVIGNIVVISMPVNPRHFCILGDYWHGENKLSIIHAYGKAVIETRLMETTAFKVVATFAIPGLVD